MNTEIAPIKSLAEQHSDFIRWQLVSKDVTADEFEYFLQVAAHLGLDPLRKQIYCIKRNTRYGAKATVQTGIDGYRLIATRTGELAGIDDALYDSEEEAHPKWARVTIFRMVQGQRCPFTSTARWNEYYPGSNPMWDKMPYLMLAKCAEALALRKAFPAELSGVYTDAEMDQAGSSLPVPDARLDAAIIKDEQRLPNEHQEYPAVEAATSDPQALAVDQQKKSIMKLSIALGREEPSVEAYETMTFNQAAAYIRQLSRDYNERQRHK